MRKYIYISERRHKEVADFIKSLRPGDVSYEIAKLMEDGMKWRKFGNNANKEVLATRGSGEVLLRNISVPSVEEKKGRAVFSDIKLERKVIDKETLDRKLNNL